MLERVQQPRVGGLADLQHPSRGKGVLLDPRDSPLDRGACISFPHRQPDQLRAPQASGELRAVSVRRDQCGALRMGVCDEILILCIVEAGFVGGPRLVPLTGEPASHLDRYALVDNEPKAPTRLPWPSAPPRRPVV